MTRKEKPFALDLLFRALADSTRLRLLNLIADREICVCYFVEILGIRQPKISRHLAYLRKASIVNARRDGKWIHYRLAMPTDEAGAGILRTAIKHLRERPEMQRDISRLSSVCCTAEKFNIPIGAPEPSFLPNQPDRLAK